MADPTQGAAPGFIPDTPAATSQSIPGFISDDSLVAARHARSQAGQNINPGDTSAQPSFAEDVATGAGKGVAETAQGAAKLVGADDLATSGALGDTDTTATGVAQHLGKAGETVLEFMLGDEALKGLSMGEKLARIAPTIKAIEAHPALAKVIGKALSVFGAGARGAIVGGAEGGVKGADTDNAVSGAEAGAVGGAATTASGEVLSQGANLVKGAMNDADAAQASAQTALRRNPWAAARTANQSLRTTLDSPIEKVLADAKTNYSIIDKTAGTDIKALYDKLENTEYQIRQLTDTEEDVAQEAKLEKARTATMDKIADARQQVVNKMGPKAGTMLDKADQLFKKGQALKDMDAKVLKNTSIVSGNAAAGTPETVNVDLAVKALQKLQDTTKYGGPRLEQALGKQGAKAMLEDLYAAQRAGVKAIAKQQFMKHLAMYVGAPVSAGALSYAGYKAAH